MHLLGHLGEIESLEVWTLAVVARDADLFGGYDQSGRGRLLAVLHDLNRLVFRPRPVAPLALDSGEVLGATGDVAADALLLGLLFGLERREGLRVLGVEPGVVLDFMAELPALLGADVGMV